MDLAGTSQKISFFEMVAWDSLYSYFEGGFKYVYSVLTSHYDSLAAYQYYTDEAFLIFDLWLEYYYLHKNNWLYSENFFSFTRSAISMNNSRLKKFSNKHKVLALLYEVVLPYLRLKLHKWYQDKKNNPANLAFDKKWLGVIPALNATYSFVDFMYKLKFLVQKDFRFFKPYLHFWSFLIRRKNMFELKREEDAYSNKLFGFLSKYNIFFIFLFVKFWQWYFSQSNVNKSSNSDNNQVCIPPGKQKRYSRACAIWNKQKVENPWALETSGYVFCFVCIQEYLEKHQQWPVTKVKTTVNNIRKIYP